MSREENPYEPPRTPSRVTGVRSGLREDLRAVAQYQKGILVCILLQIAVFIARFLVPANIVIFVLGAALVVGVAQAVFVFMLSIKVYNVVLGILLGILAIVPCLGLIVLLIINNKATNILRDNGHHVGLLGADLSKF
jgi:hypothetical protein